MARESRHFMQDILDMIAVVEKATEGKSFADFQTEDIFRLGVERAIEIISEASRHIPDELKALRAEVPWQRVKAIGNVLRHEYHGLSATIIWNASLDELPKLKVAVSAILDNLNHG